MLTRILISFFIMIFIAACGSSPKEDAGADGAGGSGLTSVDYTSDGVKAGTGDDLIINVGDRIFFEFASHELNGEAQEQLQAQAAWMKQYSNCTWGKKSSGNEKLFDWFRGGS